MTWDGEMTKTKVVDLQKLYNFVIDIFFTWIHLCFEILISKSDKDKHKKGGVDRGDKRKPLWPPITYFSRENRMTYDCLMASSLKKNAIFWVRICDLAMICRGGSKYSHLYKLMISGGGRVEAFQPPLLIQYVVVVSNMLGRWLWHLS
jgi:hypothetical protein